MALGGRVEIMKCDFIRRGEKLCFEDEFFDLPWVKDVKSDDKTWFIAQAH